jgi:hypothetical protein
MDSADVAHTVTQVRTVDKNKIYRMYFSVKKLSDKKIRRLFHYESKSLVVVKVFEVMVSCHRGIQALILRKYHGAFLIRDVTLFIQKSITSQAGSPTQLEVKLIRTVCFIRNNMVLFGHSVRFYDWV